MRVAILGAGWSGLTLAWALSRRIGAEVVLIEREASLGGLAADDILADGQIIPRHGAHIFHTPSPVAWGFATHFAPFNFYRHHIRVAWDGDLLDYPISLTAVERVYERDLTMAAAIDLLEQEGAPWRAQAGLNFETALLSQLGPRLYDIYARHYTRKMWGREPSTLAARLARRVPLRLTREQERFSEPYQGLPAAGYSALFANLADDIPTLTRVQDDYRALDLSDCDHIVVTTPIDEWYNYVHGRLEYRGMRFEIVPTAFGLPVGTVNTNDHPDVLRMEDPAHYYQQLRGPRRLVYNYASGAERFYPVPTPENDARAALYRGLADRESRVSFIGRLGRYRYIEQDQAILMALHEYERLTHDYALTRDIAMWAVRLDPNRAPVGDGERPAAG